MLVHQFNATNIKSINPVPVPIWAELDPAQPQLVFFSVFFSPSEPFLIEQLVASKTY